MPPSREPCNGRYRADDVTVVVATRDRPDRLERCLVALRLHCPGSPVIVCDDASTGSATGDAVRRHDGVRLVTLARNAGAAARNAGVREARTPLVALCDDDAWWAPGALEAAAARFAADPRLGLLHAHVLVGEEQRPDPVSALLARSPLGRRPAGPEILGFVACAVVVRRSAFLEAGGFCPRYGIGGEEQPLAIDLARRGWALAYADEIVAHHHPDRGPRPPERAARTARNDLWTAWRRRSVGTALRATVALAADARTEPVARRALLEAVGGLPWTLADRRAPVPALERQLSDLDGQRRVCGAPLRPLPAHEVVAGGRPAAAGAATVVVVARDDWTQLERTLRELTRLPERPAVVVVDDASSDGTSERIAAVYPTVGVLRLRERCGPVARNLGVAHARTRYVAFADADSWWAPGALEQAVEVLDREPRIGLLAARILVGDDEHEDPICADMAASPLGWDPDLPGRPLVSFMGGASIVRRDAFLGVGGFESRLVVGGEEELLGAELATAGWALRYLPSLTVHHHPEGERRGEVRALGLRNALWFVWRRRPWGAALGWSVHLLREAGPRPETVRGVLLAVRGLPWVVRSRRVLPPRVERGVRSLESQRRRSVALRYDAGAG